MESLVIDIETTGLNPLRDRITCIGVKENGVESNNNRFHTMSNDSEKITLQTFWDIAKNFDKLVGWNLNKFDWMFLKIRSLINKVKIQKYFHEKDRIDMMLILQTDRWQSLNTYSKLLLNREKGSVNPIILWNEKKIDELVEYNKNDVELTFDIFRQCLNCGVIQNED